MTDKRLSFKEMCAAFDVTPRTLRYYEYIELLTPEREGRSRYYGPRELARMKLIMRGRRWGFQLEEIRQWLTIYDGAGEADKAFLGHDFAQSPALAGAYNRQFPGTEHNDLRVREDIVATYRRFLEAAETRRCDEGCD